MAVTQARGAEEFSLVVGGPLYQMYVRSRLLKPPAGLPERRIAAFIVLTWLPLVLLTLASGTAVSAGLPIGTIRSRFPLPRTRTTWASQLMSSARSPHISLIRNPQE